VAIFVLALLLRLQNFTVRPLWNDEGFTILYTRMPWPDVLGLRGPYDIHPPLYYAAVKLFGLFAPEYLAGRLLSVIAGSLTILVLYDLTRRLANHRAAFVASILLALSPIHIWYSQEARQHALTLLVIALSYLVLVACRQAPSARWAISYGLTTALAPYLDYTALFALAPQMVLLVLLVKERRNRSTPLLISLALAIIAYLPWVPQAIASTAEQGTTRELYLGLSLDRFAAALNALIGLQDQGDYFQRDLAAVWQTPELFRAVMLAAAALTLLLALYLLPKRAPQGLLGALQLSVGTITAAVLADLFSPIFAARSVLAAVLGWSMIFGLLVDCALPSAWPRWTLARTSFISSVALPLLALTLVVSSVEITAANADFSLQRGPRWPEMASDLTRLSAAHPDFLVVVPGRADYVLLDVYAPGVLDSKAITSIDALSTLSPGTPDIWVAYHHSDTFAPYFDQLSQLGYSRLSQTKYLPGGLILDQYHQP
jgi:hypothetical protein